MRTFSFTVPGEPAPWGVHTRYDRSPSKMNLKSYQDTVRIFARAAMGAFPVHSGPVHLEIDFNRSVPIRAPKREPKRSAWVEAHSLMPPDWLNYFKGAEDALSGIVYLDDKQVIKGTGLKRYAEEASTVFRVTLLDSVCDIEQEEAE